MLNTKAIRAIPQLLLKVPFHVIADPMVVGVMIFALLLTARYAFLHGRHVCLPEVQSVCKNLV